MIVARLPIHTTVLEFYGPHASFHREPAPRHSASGSLECSGGIKDFDLLRQPAVLANLDFLSNPQSCRGGSSGCVIFQLMCGGCFGLSSAAEYGTFPVDSGRRLRHGFSQSLESSAGISLCATVFHTQCSRPEKKNSAIRMRAGRTRKYLRSETKTCIRGRTIGVGAKQRNLGRQVVESPEPSFAAG